MAQQHIEFDFEKLPAESRSAIKRSCRVLFSPSQRPTLPYSHSEILGFAAQNDSTEVTLNLELIRGKEGEASHFELVESGGKYILHTTKNGAAESVALIHLTMYLAEIARVPVVRHAIFTTTDGVEVLITERTDLGRRNKRLTSRSIADIAGENAAIGSYEEVIEIISRESTTTKLDIINLCERLLFANIIVDNTITANELTITTLEDGTSSLAPALIFRPTQLLTTTDKSPNGDLALRLGGKDREFTREDFCNAMRQSSIDERVAEKSVNRFDRYVDMWCDMIDIAPIDESLKDQYKFSFFVRL